MGTVGTRWYTLAEAAPILGVSVDTVRRRLKRGEFEARQVRTQHGPTWEVCLGSLQGASAPAAEGAAQGAHGADEDRSQALATWAASLLVPIAAELSEARKTIERQAGEVADLREERGRLTAELEAERATNNAYKSRLEAAEVSRRRVANRHLTLALAVLAVVATPALAALAVAPWVW